MPISLNSVSKEIIYDTNIDYYIDLNKFAGELVLSFRLPRLLHHFSDCYCVDVEEGFFELDSLKTKRKIVIAGTRNWITHNDSIGAGIQNNTDFYTSMIIAVEVKEDEMDSVISLFSEEETILRSKTLDLLQNVLEVALYRYNTTAGGTSFMIPSFIECDRLELSLYKNYLEKRYLRCCYRIYDLPILQDSEYPIKIDSFSSHVENWRFFYNKSQYEYATKKYVDSIISAAISVESYSWGILKTKFLNDEEINKYASKENDDGFLSAAALYKKMKNDRFISTTLSNTKLQDIIQKIMNPRNDIMHGKLSVMSSWKNDAEKVNALINILFASLGLVLSADACLEKGNQNLGITDYRKLVLESNFDSKYSIEEMMNKSVEMSDKYPEMELPKLNIIRCLIKSGKFSEAFDKANVLLHESTNPSAIAIAIWRIMPTDKSDLSEKLLVSVANKDERVYAALCIIYLRRYQHEGRKNKLLILQSLDCVKKSKNFNNKYVLADVLACEVLSELNSEERFHLYVGFSKLFPKLYWFPLLCAEKAMKSNETNNAFEFYKQFLNRFEQYHYVGMRFDFYTVIFDLNDLLSRSETILNYLRNAGAIDEYLNECIDIHNKCKRLPLVEKIVDCYSISAFNNGGMPQGNIIYGMPFNVAGGTFILK